MEIPPVLVKISWKADIELFTRKLDFVSNILWIIAVHIFQGTYFWNFRISLQTTGYHSVHTVRDIGLDFVIQSLPRIFLHVLSQRLLCSSLSDCCGIPFLWVMTFHWIFANHPCIRKDFSTTWYMIC